MMKRRLASVVLLCLCVTTGLAQTHKRVTIFVTSDGAVDGLTDPNKGNQDTRWTDRGRTGRTDETACVV
jgi:hypothetical protein